MEHRWFFYVFKHKIYKTDLDNPEMLEYFGINFLPLYLLLYGIFFTICNKENKYLYPLILIY